jgi:hypothetical protein
VVWAPATIQLALCELLYVFQLVNNTKLAYKQQILVFLLNFSVAIAQKQLASQPPQSWPPLAGIVP